MLAFALASTIATAAIKPATPHVFADWAVACDNGKRCEAVSMVPDGGDIGSGAGFVVRREAGPAGLISLDLRSPQGLTGPVTIRIDGKIVGAMTLDAGGKADIAGPAAAAVVEKLANAGTIRLMDAADTPIGTLSSKGSAAALRFMDAEQGRAGGVSALVAKGRKSARLVPPAPALPIVPAVPSPAVDAAPLPDATVAEMRKASGCDATADDGPVSAQTSALDAQSTLVLVSCGSGAYNFTTAPFVVTGGKAAFARFDVDIGDGDTQAASHRPLLVNAIWNSKLGTLFSYAKGRGIGDCGVSRTFVWDGERFRLVEAAMLGECRGAIAWPTIWRATVKRL